MRIIHRKTGTRIYRIWRGLQTRCQNKKVKDFPRYGGRGITVCEEWDASFLAFESWALANGYADDLCIDRIDNDSGYSPENCRWVTLKANNGNRCSSRFLEAFGETKTMSQWTEDERCIVCKATFEYRIRTGWDVEAAIVRPATPRGFRLIVDKMAKVL